MRILIVSQSILPYKGGSSIIIENLAKNFSDEELIIVGSRRLRHTLTANRPKFHYFLSELSFFGRGSRFFNWFRKFRFNPLKKFIRKIAEEKEVDYIIGVYPNSFYCLAACQVAKEMQLPFSSYFHNTYIENFAIRETNAIQIQKEIFDASKYVFVMSEGMRRFYEERYGGHKFVPLVHTFQEAPELDPFSPLPSKDSYQLVAIGNFNESNIDATKRVIKAISRSGKYKLNLYTHVPKVLLQQRGIPIEHINHMGFINPEDVHEALLQYDICILTHGFEGGYGEVEYRTIFPTRTIPLLLSGKPIFAHSPPGSFLNDFIDTHKCALLVDVKDEKAILEGLDKLVGNIDLQQKLYDASKETKKMFYGPDIANFLRKKLNSED